MAVTWASGFEGRQKDLDGINFGGSVAYGTSSPRTGAAFISMPFGGSITGLGGGAGDWFNFGFRVNASPGARTLIHGPGGTGGGLDLYLSTSMTLTVEQAAVPIVPASAALSTGVWYWIGLRRVTGTGVVWLQINGLAEGGTGTATITTTVQTLGSGSGDYDFDDLILDNAGFLAPSKVDLALPISDNTRTAVTTGNGGTTNLWDAVNNTPPTGVVSASETATTNVEYPASLTEDYIANLETYTTLGVAAGDTVLAVRSIVQHGEDIVTGTKNLQNIGALTNPTVAGVSATAGADAGAHGATPTLWTTTLGTLTTSPSVTLGTSPTIRTSRISEARVACIDFMGMLVAWTPAAAARVPYVNPMPQLLAQ